MRCNGTRHFECLATPRMVPGCGFQLYVRQVFMSDSLNLSADPELLAGFLDESRDLLGGIADQLVALEHNQGQLQLVESIFRAAHSIKGNSAFFGFLKAKHLAHRLENVLDAIRKARLIPDHEVVSLLLRGFDTLTTIFERLRQGGLEIDDLTAFETLLADASAQEARAGEGSDIDWSVVRKDITAAEKSLAQLPDDARWSVQILIRHLRRCDPSKGNSVADALAKVVTPSAGPLAELARILTPPLDGLLAPEASELVRIALEAIATAAADEAAKGLASDLLDGYRTFTEAMGFDPLLRDFLRERLDRIPTMPGFALLISTSSPAPQTVIPEVTAPTSASTTEAPAAVAKTMRVSEERIDTFLHYVGELLVVGDQFSHLHSQTRQLSAVGGSSVQRLSHDLRRANESFAELSNKLQKAIMAIRKVQVRPLLQKIPRIIRETALAKGKEIHVELLGEALEIDKSLIDLLDAPITHMSRNAADHGIEMPDDREKAGKPRMGTVLVTVTETSASIVLSIADDGKGLDLVRIRAKAESLGIVKPGAVFSERDLINCIFAPGLSTADQVTEISGRGVGMDVVKRAIEDSGGAINITTTAGVGSKFTLTMPKRVTTRIMPGYLVRLGSRLFAIPLERIRETFAFVPDQITTVAGRGRCILRHNEVLPVVSLAEVTGLDGHPHDGRRILVTIQSRDRRVAIEVDGVAGVQKVVVRDIVGLPVPLKLISGGALMGDGTVALVLDAESLILGTA